MTDFIALVLIFFGLYCAGQLTKSYQLPFFEISKQRSALNIDKNIASIFHLGNKRMFTNLIWIQTLLEGDLEHYNKKDLNNWMYHRFDAISHLDPLFYENYRYGGQYLSVIKDDDLGAINIYERGLKHYLTDYSLNFHTAYHYYFELKSAEKSYPIFNRIKNHEKAPSWIKSLTLRLENKLGLMNQDAFLVIKELYNNAKDGSSIKQHYYQSLYAIRAQADLNCLNSKKTNCSLKDLDGKNYIKRNKTWIAQKKWRAFLPSK